MENKSDDVIESKLEAIYTDPKNPGAFRGIQALYRAARVAGVANITLASVKRFLKNKTPTHYSHSQNANMHEHQYLRIASINNGRLILRTCKNWRPQIRAIVSFSP